MNKTWSGFLKKTNRTLLCVARTVLAVRTTACLFWVYIWQLRYKVKFNIIVSLSDNRGDR